MINKFGITSGHAFWNEAKKLLGKIATGIDPIAEKKAQSAM